MQQLLVFSVQQETRKTTAKQIPRLNTTATAKTVSLSMPVAANCTGTSAVLSSV